MSEYVVNLDGELGMALAVACAGGGFVREEIVRCRDCRYGINSGELCAEGASDSWDWRNVEPDGYCAWGVRKEGGDD